MSTKRVQGIGINDYCTGINHACGVYSATSARFPSDAGAPIGSRAPMEIANTPMRNSSMYELDGDGKAGMYRHGVDQIWWNERASKRRSRGNERSGRNETFLTKFKSKRPGFDNIPSRHTLARAQDESPPQIWDDGDVDTGV
jgi:hypothetical protein